MTGPKPQAQKPPDPFADDKRHAFECFYRGWRDFMESREYAPPPSWDEQDQQRYLWGWNNANEARDLFLEGATA